MATGGLWLRLSEKSPRREDFNGSSAQSVRVWQAAVCTRGAGGRGESALRQGKVPPRRLGACRDARFASRPDGGSAIGVQLRGFLGHGERQEKRGPRVGTLCWVSWGRTGVTRSLLAGVLSGERAHLLLWAWQALGQAMTRWETRERSFIPDLPGRKMDMQGALKCILQMWPDPEGTRRPPPGVATPGPFHDRLHARTPWSCWSPAVMLSHLQPSPCVLWG